MNKYRRKEIDEILGKLNILKDDLQTCLDEEEECRDNFPENLQTSERYETSENACSSLEDAISYLEDAVCELENILNG